MVLAILLVTLGSALLKAITSGMGPVPQLPPTGYVAERGMVVLQWNKGNIEAPITLQISKTKDFESPVFEKEVSGVTYNFQNDLERGRRYYWRLIQEDRPSPVSTFVISEYHVKL